MDKEILALTLAPLAVVLAALIGVLSNAIKNTPSKKNTLKYRLLQITLIIFGAFLLIFLGILGFVILGKTEPIEAESSTATIYTSASQETLAGNTSVILPKNEEKVFINAKPGDIREFGEYKAEDDTNGKKQPIEWIVLSTENDKALVLSVEGLDTQPFHAESDKTTWANSNICNWLNIYFYDNAFSEEEKDQILKTSVKPDENGNIGSEISGIQDDYIFLLSVKEVESYIKYNPNLGNADSYMRCKPTESVKPHVHLSNDGYGWWWLRTPLKNNTRAYRIESHGFIDSESHKINTEQGLVRPAMWVKTK